MKQHYLVYHTCNLLIGQKPYCYDVILFFIWIDNIELAKSRVATRVSKGGHNIPDNVIERRYKKGIKNFSEYASQVGNWYVYDNSGSRYILAAKSINGAEEIFNFEIFEKIANR
ncbi:MAG: hypothetical protein M3R50_09345 [Bacteroidota bacterium]|nr:hypothetical protein [Bacteroidota bacterium]